jgi:4-amino-4-deoxy-L-arabinose transferase-like glycosyltransferase
MTPDRKRLVRVFAALSFIVALILISLLFLPYSSLKAFADRLVADGELESLTPHLAQALRIPWGVVSGISLFAAVWSILRPNAFLRLLSLGLDQFTIWRRDLTRFVVDLKLLRLSRAEIAFTIAICSLGLVARLMLINRPIEYDEAYTVMAFAHSPFRTLISDYHLPNNHVFHSILVRIAVLLLGSQPWQIRMPVLVAGLLLVPFVFWLGRTLYTREVGYLSAAIVAFLPDMVERSVSARGYIIVALLAVMTFLLACYLVRRRNLFAWSLLVMLCALGFYTVPIMLFAFGFLLLWMLLSLRDLDNDQYTRSAWILHLVAAGLMVILLTLLLYSPIFLSTGMTYIFPSSGILLSQTLQSMFAGLPGLISRVVAEWTSRLPGLWRGVFILGLLLTPAGIRGPRKLRVHTAAAFLVAILILLLIERPNPVGRIWLWVIPFAAIWVSAGLGVLLLRIPGNRVGQGMRALLLASVVIGLAATGIGSSRQRVIDNDFESPEMEEVAAVLAPRLTEASAVVVDYGWDAYIWYYLYLQGVDRPLIFRPGSSRPFDEVFALVATEAPSCHNPQVLETLMRVGPELARLNLGSSREVAQIDLVKICWIPVFSQ